MLTKVTCLFVPIVGLKVFAFAHVLTPQQTTLAQASIASPAPNHPPRSTTSASSSAAPPCNCPRLPQLLCSTRSARSPSSKPPSSSSRLRQPPNLTRLLRDYPPPAKHREPQRTSAVARIHQRLRIRRPGRLHVVAVRLRQPPSGPTLHIQQPQMPVPALQPAIRHPPAIRRHRRIPSLILAQRTNPPTRVHKK